MGKPIVLTSPSCPHCGKWHAASFHKRFHGDVEELSVATREGRRAADDVKAKYVPFCVAEKKGGGYRRCTPSEAKEAGLRG